MTLTARERKLVAIAILMAAIMLVFGGLLFPVLNGLVEHRAERLELRAQYGRNAGIIAQLPFWRKRLQIQEKTAARFSLLAASDGAAAELLKERLGKIIAETGGEAQAMEDLPPSDGRVRAGLRARLTLGQLVAALRAMQSQPPPLQIDALGISAEQAFTTGRLSPMDVQFEISAAYTQAAPR